MHTLIAVDQRVCMTVRVCAQSRPRMQRMSVIISFQKCHRSGVVRVRSSPRGSGRVGSSRAINGVPTPTLTLQLSHLVMSWRMERTMFCLGQKYDLVTVFTF